MKTLMPGFRKQSCALLVSACLVVSTTPISAEAADNLPRHTSAHSNVSRLLTPSSSGLVSGSSAVASASLSLSAGDEAAANFRMPALSPAATKEKSFTTSPQAMRQPARHRKARVSSKAKFHNVSNVANQLTFVENKGQFDGQVKFQVSNAGRALWLTRTGISFDFQQCKSTEGALLDSGPARSDPNSVGQRQITRLARKELPDCSMERHVIGQDFLGASQQPVIETKGIQSGVRNYLAGNDPAKWQTQVRGFSEVVYRDVWIGVDLKLYGKGPDLEQEFIVKPGADFRQVQVAYKGIKKLEVAKDGSLLISAAAGHMRESRPRIYQEIAGQRVPVRGSFRLLSATSYTFDVPAHNEKYPLVIDPTLLYSTFLGGSAGNNVFTIGTRETATGIAVDQSGNAYVTGFTQSADFPTTAGAFQTTSGGGQQTFVSKLNAAGSALIYSTYLNASFPTSIAVDSASNAYIAGSNAHPSFPTTGNAYNPTCDAIGGSAFLTVLNPSGSALIYSTCFGSSAPNGGAPVVTSMAADAQSHAYVAGSIGIGSTLPTTPNAFQPTYPGSLESGFVMEFDTSLSGTNSLVYSTYLGIAGPFDGAHPGTTASAAAIDSFGKIYLTGFTADGFPVTPGAFQTVHAPCIPNGIACPSSGNAYITKLDPAVSGQQSLIYATYLGGMGSTVTNAIAVDAQGAVYVTGSTDSSRFGSFPITPGAFQVSAGLAAAASFVTKLNAGGSQLVYSTFVSDLRSSAGNSIALDSLGNAYIAGQVNGSTFPVTPDAFQSSYAGPTTDFGDAFITKLNSTGSALLYSSYLGATGDDGATAVAVDQGGDAYLVGHTASSNFPMSIGSFQPSMHGTGDAFVTKVPLGTTFRALQILPNIAGNAGTFSGTIYGGGFQGGATVSLRGVGPDIVATAVGIGTEGRLLGATFDLHGAAPGLRDVVVTNPDGSTATVQQGFSVSGGGAPDLYVDIIGRFKILTFATSDIYVVVGNRGTVNASGVPLFVGGIPSTWGFSVASPIQQPPRPALPFDLRTISPIAETGTPLGQLAALFIPFVPAGGQVVVHFTISPSFTSNTPVSLQAWTGTPFFQSPLNPQVGSCLISAVNEILTISGFVPFVSCPTTLAIQLESILTAVVGTGWGLWTGSATTIGLVFSFWQILASVASVAIACSGGSALNFTQWVSFISSSLQLITDCAPFFTRNRFILNILSVSSLDPNDLVGIPGIGVPGYISPVQSLAYGIFFQNLPDATAAAQKIVVTNSLDPSLDVLTLTLGEITLGGKIIPLSSTFVPFFGEYRATGTLDLRPTQNLIVNTNVLLDPVTRTLSWQFAAINPSTGLPPSDPSMGVLAPGIEGSISYSAKPLQNLATGTVISNRAKVVFDQNAAINTPTWINTIDDAAPISQVTALLTSEPASGFNLAWSGTDSGSGIQDFTIFVSDNGGPFTPFQTNTTATSATFTGQVGHTYGFYSIARDFVGNVEAAKSAAEATTQVVLVTDSTPPTTAALVTSLPNAVGWNNSNVTITLNSADDASGTGVKQIAYSVSGAQTVASTTLAGPSTSFSISTEGITTITFFAVDNAGNAETPKTITIKVDKTPPSITGARTPAPIANGWNNSQVSVGFTCVDTLSGLAPGSPPAPTILSTEGANQSVTGTCQDVAGNSASTIVSEINIDTTPPSVACSVTPNVLWPPNNELVTANATVTVTDFFSGPAGFNLVSVTSSEPDSGQGDIQGFVPETPSVLGQFRAQRLGSGNGRVYTLTYVSSDRAGNPATCTTTVTVPHDQGH